VLSNAALAIPFAGVPGTRAVGVRAARFIPFGSGKSAIVGDPAGPLARSTSSIPAAVGTSTNSWNCAVKGVTLMGCTVIPVPLVLSATFVGTGAANGLLEAIVVSSGIEVSSTVTFAMIDEPCATLPWKVTAMGDITLNAPL
jgi:hypothetical protein